MMSNGIEKYNDVGVVTMKLYKIGKNKYIQNIDKIIKEISIKMIT